MAPCGNPAASAAATATAASAAFDSPAIEDPARQQLIERAVLVCDGNAIHGHHLPPTLQTAEASETVTNTSLTDAVEQFEKDLILDALKTTRGNRAKAARLLRTTERIVNYKVTKYEIDCSRFRA